MKLLKIRLTWYVKQLLPLTYRTTHQELDEEGEVAGTFFVVWNMWLGRCFNVEKYTIIEG